MFENVFAPEVSSDLPVMIWFYGGGFMVGGSMGANFLNNYLYSGQEIADRGNVIVVTVGYRVGVLGFLSSGDSGIPGNDMVASCSDVSMLKNPSHSIF